MSHQRPAYLVKVSNLTRGWGFETYQGEQPDLEEPVQLLDDLTHTWSFVDQRVPGPWEPATVSFGLAARSAADLPTFEIDDIVQVEVSRPLPAWPGTPTATRAWFVLEGRITDPTLDMVAHSNWPVRANITVVDFLADLNSRFPRPGFGGVPFLGGRATMYAQYARLNTYLPADLWSQAPANHAFVSVDADPDSSAHDWFCRHVATGPVQATVAYPRPALGLATEAEAPTWWPDNYAAPYAGDMGAFVSYWLQPIYRELPRNSPSPMRLVANGSVIGAEVRPDAEQNPTVAVISACHIPFPLQFRKARENAVNSVVVHGFDGNTIFEPDGTVVQPSETTRSVSTTPDGEFGTVTRNIETHAPLDDTGTNQAQRAAQLSDIGSAYLPDDSVSLSRWGLDEVPLRTWNMDDVELDRYAGMFYPPHPLHDPTTAPAPAPSGRNAGSPVLRQLLVTDVDGDVLLDPPLLAGVVVGATHRIYGGRLEVTPRIVGMVLPPHATSTAITATQLAARPVPIRNVTAQTIDPTLTAVDFRLIGI